MSLLKAPTRRRFAQKPHSVAHRYRWMRTAHLPVSFFIRNLAYLEREPWFIRKGPAHTGNMAAILFLERVWCFLEIRRLIAPHRTGADWKQDASPPHNAPPRHDGSYCTHCGGCCEIASGLAEFPDESELPHRWRVCFGEGLGPGHRFCAFMWEGDRPGTSRCAIHPWRANPCRVFEADDCEMFMQDGDFLSFSRSPRLETLRRLLPRILRSRTARRRPSG